MSDSNVRVPLLLYGIVQIATIIFINVMLIPVFGAGGTALFVSSMLWMAYLILGAFLVGIPALLLIGRRTKAMIIYALIMYALLPLAVNFVLPRSETIGNSYVALSTKPMLIFSISVPYLLSAIAGIAVVRHYIPEAG